MSRSYHESVKNKNSVFVKNLIVGETYKDSIVICGGGIRSVNDIANYNHGDHHSISTLCFNPFKLTKLFYDLSKK